MALKVTQTRSAIGCKPKQRGTLRALGLGRIGRANVLPDRPEIRGMIHRVPHLVTVEEVSEEAEKAPPAAKEAVAEKSTPAPADEGKTVAKKATKKAAKKATTKKATKKAAKKAAKKS